MLQNHAMETQLIYQDQLTFIFSIANVSHLLIFRDHWNQSNVMRQVIASLIDNQLFQTIYLGSRHKKVDEAFFDDLNDAAVISLRVSGLQKLGGSAATIESVFSQALCNKSNIMHFDNTRMSRERNVSAIDVGIKITNDAKVSNCNDDVSAA